jgi:hypothetical protein
MQSLQRTDSGSESDYPDWFQDMEQPPNESPEPEADSEASPDPVASPASWDRRNISGSTRIPIFVHFSLSGVLGASARQHAALLHLARAFSQARPGALGDYQARGRRLRNEVNKTGC